MTTPTPAPTVWHLTGHVTNVEATMVDMTSWADEGERLAPGHVCSVVRVTADHKSPAVWNGSFTVAGQWPIGTRFTITVEAAQP